jgi:hypothetical protein
MVKDVTKGDRNVYFFGPLGAKTIKRVLKLGQEGLTTLNSLLKETLYFFIYSEGFMPNNL